MRKVKITKYSNTIKIIFLFVTIVPYRTKKYFANREYLENSFELHHFLYLFLIEEMVEYYWMFVHYRRGSEK